MIACILNEFDVKKTHRKLKRLSQREALWLIRLQLTRVDRTAGRRESEHERHRVVAYKKRTRAAGPSSHFPIPATVAPHSTSAAQCRQTTLPRTARLQTDTNAHY